MGYNCSIRKNSACGRGKNQVDAVLAAAIANPRFARPYGSDIEETRYDIGDVVKASDTFIKQHTRASDKKPTLH